MHRSSVPLVAGALLIAAAVAVDRNQRTGHAEDLRGIATLRRVLDSTRTALAAAPTAADSARIAEEVKEREYFLGGREFHVPHRQEGLDAFWKPTGHGTIFVAAGGAFIILGLVLLRPPRSRSS